MIEILRILHGSFNIFLSDGAICVLNSPLRGSDPELRPSVAHILLHPWVANINVQKEHVRRRPSSQFTAVPDAARSQAARQMQRSVSAGRPASVDGMIIELGREWSRDRCRMHVVVHPWLLLPLPFGISSAVESGQQKKNPFHTRCSMGYVCSCPVQGVRLGMGTFAFGLGGYSHDA